MSSVFFNGRRRQDGDPMIITDQRLSRGALAITNESGDRISIPA